MIHHLPIYSPTPPPCRTTPRIFHLCQCPHHRLSLLLIILPIRGTVLQLFICTDIPLSPSIKIKSESTAQGKINYSSVQRDERRTLLFEVEVTGDDSKEEECEIDIPVRYLCFTGNSNDRS